MAASTFPELLDSYLDALEERLTNLTRNYPGQRTALDILREQTKQVLAEVSQAAVPCQHTD